jgi:hypothetical protein
MGQRDLGAAVGDFETRMAHISAKVSRWQSDVLNLSRIAKYEPHAAHAAFVHGLRHCWTFIQRTMPNIEVQLQPLENSIREQFIPSLLGRTVSDSERCMLALPGRFGGAAIDNPVKSARMKYEDSVAISNSLAERVIEQACFSLSAPHEQQQIVDERRQLRERIWKNEVEVLKSQLPASQQRALECAQETGASAILTPRPLIEFGFALPKNEFRDIMLMRYNWPLSNMPTTCPCGHHFDVHHSQVCKLGGFVHMRHNDVRDFFGEECKKVLNDVQLEPPLQPLTGEHIFPASANKADDARADI